MAVLLLDYLFVKVPRQRQNGVRPLWCGACHVVVLASGYAISPSVLHAVRFFTTIAAGKVDQLARYLVKVKSATNLLTCWLGQPTSPESPSYATAADYVINACIRLDDKARL